MSLYTTTITEEGKQLLLESLNGTQALNVSHMGIGTKEITGNGSVVPDQTNPGELIPLTGASVNTKHKNQLSYSAVLTPGNDPYKDQAFTIEKIYLFANKGTAASPIFVHFSTTDFPPTLKLRTDDPNAVMNHSIEVIIAVYMDDMGDRTIHIEPIDPATVRAIVGDL